MKSNVTENVKAHSSNPPSMGHKLNNSSSREGAAWRYGGCFSNFIDFLKN